MNTDPQPTVIGWGFSLIYHYKRTLRTQINKNIEAVCNPLLKKKKIFYNFTLISLYYIILSFIKCFMSYANNSFGKKRRLFPASFIHNVCITFNNIWNEWAFKNYLFLMQCNHSNG